jgi:hypothetical protein
METAAVEEAICLHRGDVAVKGSVFPALLDNLTDSFDVLAPIVLVEVRRFHVGWRRGVGIVEQAAAMTTLISAELMTSIPGNTVKIIVPLDAGEDGRDIICRAPAVLKDVQTKLAAAIDIGVEHLTDELHARGLIGILLLEVHDETESAILEWRVCRANDDGVPEERT